MGERIPNFNGKRLLIVEDNQLNMEIFKEIIGFTGIEIDEAFDGIEAIEKVAESPEGYYNLILSDIRMLYMNGYLMTNSIRRMNRTDVKTIPIIGMTADREECRPEEAIEAGMNEQIYKPFGVEEIIPIFNRYISECNEREGVTY